MSESMLDKSDSMVNVIKLPFLQMCFFVNVITNNYCSLFVPVGMNG